MAHLAIVRLGGRGRVIGGGKPFGARPFGEHAEEAGGYRDAPGGLLVGEVAPEARLPDLPVWAICLPASLSFAESRRFIEDLDGRFPPASCPGAFSASESHR